MSIVRKPPLLNWALAFTATCLCLVCVESLARVILYRRSQVGMVFENDIVYSYAPRARVNDIVMNNIGCIGDDVSESPPPDAIKVLLLGGSTSFSKKYVDSVRTRLAEKLPNKHPIVFSCGRPRYTSYVNRINFENHLLQYHPDVVVLYLGINDNIYNSFPWLNDIPNIGFFNWKDFSRLVSFQLFEHYVLEKKIWSHPNFGSNELRSVPIFRKNLQGIISLAKQNHIAVVASTFAVAVPTEDPVLDAYIKTQEPIMEHFWGTRESTLLGVKAHNAEMISIAKEHGLPVADVSSVMPRDGLHFIDICHLTNEGNSILGQTIADSVIQLFHSNGS